MYNDFDIKRDELTEDVTKHRPPSKNTGGGVGITRRQAPTAFDSAAARHFLSQDFELQVAEP
jgi:hypothetical protein